jgi:tRNA nucleotidyltransferase (CCA-adding enzyme)
LQQLEARIRRELAAPIEQRQLAVDGHDLMAERGLPPGPLVGELLERLMEAVLEEPERNRQPELLRLAAELLRAKGGTGAP